MSEENIENTQSGMSITRVLILAVGGLIGLVVILFVIGLIMALTDIERWSLAISMLRDYVVIVMTIIGILIVVGIALLAFQIARLISLLRSEGQVILSDTKETVSSARGTVEFVGKTTVEPVINTSRFVSGLVAFLREIVKLYRVIQPPATSDDEQLEDPEATDLPESEAESEGL